MVYFEEGKFKRYVKKIKDTSKNPKSEFREVQQLNITGLSKNSKFEDKQRVSIMDYTEFTNLLDDFQTQEAKLSEVTQELEEAKLTIMELEGKLDKTPETVSNTNKILELVDKLEDKQTIIDNHKNIIIQANDKVNTLIEEVTSEVTLYFTDGVSKANLDTQVKVTNLLRDIKEINKSTLLLMQKVQDQVNNYNSKYDNSNRVKRFFMDKINIDFEELESNKGKLKEFNRLDIEETAKNLTKRFTIDNDKIQAIKNNTKSKKLDFKELYLTDKTSSQDVNINIDNEENQDQPQTSPKPTPNNNLDSEESQG